MESKNKSVSTPTIIKTRLTTATSTGDLVLSSASHGIMEQTPIGITFYDNEHRLHVIPWGNVSEVIFASKGK